MPSPVGNVIYSATSRGYQDLYALAGVGSIRQHRVDLVHAKARLGDALAGVGPLIAQCDGGRSLGRYALARVGNIGARRILTAPS